LGPRFGTLIWGVIWDPDLGGDLVGDLGGDPTFRTPILELISKFIQNSSDMNEIILAPCDVISKIKQILLI
jgi:hypothetical protein